MLRRNRIVQARLTWEETERLEPLIKERHLESWSELIRSALKHYWQLHQSGASDNDVIQTNSQTQTRPAKPTAKKSPTRRNRSRRGKSKV